MQFELGFYTPGTREAKRIEREEKRREKKMKQMEPKLPTVDRTKPAPLKITHVHEHDGTHRPRITLPRKDGFIITGPSFFMHAPLDDKDRIEIRKRELCIRERLSDNKSDVEHRWYKGLLASLDTAPCL